MEIPRVPILSEDPPMHDLHRGLLSRLFTPRKVSALEPKVRDFCARCLDPLVGAGGFDFIRHLGAQVPMRTIGMLLGIPEQDQEAIRDAIDEGLRLSDSNMPDPGSRARYVGNAAGAFKEYIDWRGPHPPHDLMDELAPAARPGQPRTP